MKQLRSIDKADWMYFIFSLKFTAQTFCHKIEKIHQIKPLVDTRRISNSLMNLNASETQNPPIPGDLQTDQEKSSEREEKIDSHGFSEQRTPHPDNIGSLSHSSPHILMSPKDPSQSQICTSSTIQISISQTATSPTQISISQTNSAPTTPTLETRMSTASSTSQETPIPTSTSASFAFERQPITPES